MDLHSQTHEDESCPEGYSEALKDCTALATNLLSQAVTGESIKRCWDCAEWVGRCKKGHVWVIARDEACSEFTPKQKNIGIKRKETHNV